MEENNTYFIDKEKEEELARLMVQDLAYSEVLDLLPVEFVPVSGARVLDLACGPGGWALQVSSAYPDLSVVAVDLSPQMIRWARAQAEAQQASTQFSIMDILHLPWSFPDCHFDLVNARFITSLVPRVSLAVLYQECLRVLRPGGILRYTEGVSVSAPMSTATHRLNLLACEATYKAGLSFSPYEMGTAAVTEEILRQFGFKDLTLTPYVVDLSHDAPLHKLMRENWIMAHGLLLPFLLKYGESLDEIQALRNDFNRDWNAKNFCGHYYLCSLVGRKPAAD